MTTGKLLLIWIFIVLSGESYAQFPEIDDLKQRYYHSSSDQQKIQALLDFLSHKNSIPGDTMSKYASIGCDLAMANGSITQKGWMHYYLAASKLAKGLTDSTLLWLDQRPELQPMYYDDQTLQWRLQLLRANALNRKNERSKALELQLDGLKWAEKLNDTLAIAYYQNYIGATYLNSNERAKSKHAWLLGLQVVTPPNQRDRAEIYATLHSNKALWFVNAPVDSINILRDSLEYSVAEVIRYSKRYGFHWLHASALSVRAMQRMFLKDTVHAREDLFTALQIHQQIGDPLYIVHDLGRIGGFFLAGKQFDSGIAYLNQAIRLAQRSEHHEGMVDLFAALSFAYKAKGDMPGYVENLEKLLVSLDSSYSVNTAGKIKEIESRYQLQKIETELANQKLNLYRQNLLFYGLLLLGLGLILMVWLIFRRYKRKQLLAHQQALLKTEIALHEAKESERQRIAADLHDHLGIQAHAVLYQAEKIREFPEHVNHLSHRMHDLAREMLYGLRETVWALKHDEVTAEVLWVRIIHFCRRTATQFPEMEIQSMGQKPPAFPLSAERSLHLMMILMEGMNNALKHSGASRVQVKSEVGGEHWLLCISDNGKGFAYGMEAVANEGNGLQNMKERSAKLGAQIEIITGPQKGTVIKIVIPFKSNK